MSTRQVCIPVGEYCGLDSPVYGHFGSAPCFAVVDSDTMAVERLSNRDKEHVHGACSPMKALAGQKIDAILVGGIGPGALMGLRQAGVAVFLAPEGSVSDVLRLFKDGKLKALDEKRRVAVMANRRDVAVHAEPMQPWRR